MSANYCIFIIITTLYLLFKLILLINQVRVFILIKENKILSNLYSGGLLKSICFNLMHVC